MIDMPSLVNAFKSECSIDDPQSDKSTSDRAERRKIFCNTFINSIRQLNLPLLNSQGRCDLKRLSSDIFQILYPKKHKYHFPVCVNPNQRLVGVLARLTDESCLIQINHILGQGVHKDVFEGLLLTFSNQESFLKVSATSVAVLKVSSDIDSAQREDELARIFNSSHVVKKSWHQFTVDECLYMVNEKFVCDLDDVTYNRVCLTPEKKIRVLKGAAKGLSKIHQLGYIHRDVKPGNIAISRTGKGVMIDLGFTIKQNSRHHINLSPLYAPPELAIDPAERKIADENLENYWKLNSQTASGDLWAFGITLYQSFHPKNEDPPFLLTAITLLEMSAAQNSVTKIDSKVFLDSLFINWPATDTKSLMLQEVIRQLLSPKPLSRGSSHDLYLVLKKNSSTSSD